MAYVGSRRGAADKLTLPLMILSFLVVAGFLYWLNVTAEPTQVVIQEEEEPTSSGASAILDVEDFLGDALTYDGQLIEVTDARIASRLGPQAFWIGPDDAPFLVKMGPELVEAGQEIPVEERVSLTGTVHVMTDSIHAAWDAQGAFPSQGDKIVAEFNIGSPYLEITDLRVPGGGGGGESGEGGASSAG